MMFNRLRLPILLAALTSMATFAVGQSESQKLSVRLGELYQAGDLDAAIPVAEEIVAIERRSSASTKIDLRTAIESLGQLKLDRFKRSLSELRDPTIDQERSKALVAMFRTDAGQAETHLREAIELSASTNDDAMKAINVRSKLAWLSYNYIPADPDPSFGFDKDSRDKIELRQRATYVGRYDQARRLYTDSRDIADRSGDPAASIRANFLLAEFEVAMGNLEAAIPLYEKIIADSERLLPRRSPDLLAPYDAYLKVLVATGQEDKAFDILSKIVMVTGRSAEYPKTLLSLTRRAERSYAPVNSLRVEEEAKKVKAERELAGRSIVARVSAAGGDAPAAALANSVDGRSYYETLAAKGIRLKSVIVVVELGEDGKAITANANSTDKALRETAEAAVRDWTFRPLVVDGKPAKLKGYAEVSILSN